jgi:hypothetical protein
VRAIASACYGPLLEAFVKENWVSRNIRARRLAKMNYPGFVVDYDVVTPTEVVSAPFYNFLRSYGGGWGAGTIIPVPTGDLIVFNVERSGEKGPLDRSVLAELDQLLARSALISVRLGLRPQDTKEIYGLGSMGSKVVVAVVVGIGSPMFSQFTSAFNGTPTGRFVVIPQEPV